MLLRRLFTILSLFLATHAGAQLHMQNFCEAIDTVMKESENKFRPILGRMMESNMDATMWSSTIKIPGTIGYRIVSSGSFFYEGALIQTIFKKELMPVYEQYKQKITDCLAKKGYKISYQDNMTEGLKDYKKVVWMIPPKEGMTADELPPHVTMEVTYSKQIEKYTIVMFIFQH